MTILDIPQRRMLNHRISGGRFGLAEDAVRWMGAIQAQDYGQAVWAIGLRLRDDGLADVERAIADGRILRTWPMRGTIHFVPAEDAQWMLRLLTPRRLAGDALRLRLLGLDEGILVRCRGLFRDALEGGGRLTRSGMMGLLEHASIDPKAQRGSHILRRLAQEGLICIGPMQGKEQTFALLDEWAPSPRSLSREEALAELAGRYFASRGPATVADFAVWSGLTLADARAGLQSVRSRLVSHAGDGRDYWRAESAPGPASDDVPSLHLLPGFDEYLLGYKHRGDVLAPEHAGRIVPGGNGVFAPMMVADGRIVGVWKRSFRKHAVDITMSLFAPLDIPTQRWADAAEQYADFVSLPLSSLEFGAVGSEP